MRRFWDGLAAMLENELASEDRPEYRRRRSRMLKHLLGQGPRGKRILEVGCGPGGNLAALEAVKPKTLVGCDVAPKMLRLASSRTRARLVQSGADQLPFADGAFDLVLSITVLQHITDDKAARDLCAEMTRVTTKRVVIYEDMHESGNIGDAGYPWKTRPRAWYAARFNEAGMVKQKQTRLGALVDHEDTSDSGFFCLEFYKGRKQ